MIVRCGACRTQFDVPGPGRFQCPTCGATNAVGNSAVGGGGAPPRPAAGAAASGGLAGVPPPPPVEEPPANVGKVQCGDCSFEFYVGEIDVATCPNCGAEVSVEGGE